MGGIYGGILLAWGAGAIPSPILIARLRQTTGRYDQAVFAIAAVMLVAIVLPLIVRRPAPPRPLRDQRGSMPPAEARSRV
jgi:MFS transporter, OFA family, oxalate/formate antiporter